VGLVKNLIRCLAAALLALAPAAANAEWREAETAHFRVYSDAGENQIVQFAQKLEGLDALLHRATGTRPVADPTKVRVILLDTLQMVQHAMRTRDTSIAGFYTVNIEGPIAVSSGSRDSDYLTTPEITLFHEYAHHFMLEYFPATYPAWYVEGFAELASTATLDSGGKMAFGKAASHRGYSLTSSRWIPIPQLLESTYASFPDDADFYGESWLLSHYLTFSEKRAGQLRKYLNALAAGVPNLDAAKAAFGDLDQLSREVHIYLDQANFSYRQVPIELPAREAIRIRALSPGEADLMQETAGLSYGFSKEEMAAYLAGLARKVERYPSDPYGLQLLADAEYQAEDYPASRKAVDRLLAVAPQSLSGRVRKAMILLNDAESLDGTQRRAKVAEARTLIVAANQSSVNDPQPLIAYYRSFVTAGERPTAQAITGLAQAVETVPADEGPRMMLVNQLVNDGRLADAVYYLQPVAYDPHRGKGRNQALEMLESLKQRLAGGAGAKSATKPVTTPAS
jgi:predicted Zn-dependent protease